VDNNVLPALIDFVAIPNQSQEFDPEFHTNGLIQKAITHCKSWVEAQGVTGLTIEEHKEEGAGPLLLLEIPGTKPEAKTVLMYSHMDKQPPMEPWDEGLGPASPVVRGDKLYGRGSSDDGYGLLAGITMIKTLQKFGEDHPRVVYLCETEEESGSPNLLTYIDKLKPKIGSVDTVMIIDSGGANYDQLWTDGSLRGVLEYKLNVSLMKSAMHSGEGSGAVASSFRVLRQLLDRIEDPVSGEIKLPELHAPLPPRIYSAVAKTVATIGPEHYLSGYSKHEQT